MASVPLFKKVYGGFFDNEGNGMMPYQKRAIVGLSLIAATQVVFFDPAIAEGNAKAGRVVAQQCQVCHGLDGQAVIVEAPNLSGQKEMYLVIQLSAFRSGERKNEMMGVVAPTLSDQQIEDVAAYYASIPITLGKLPGE